MSSNKIDLEEDIKPVSSFRANSAAMIRHVRESGRPMILTQHGRSTAVLLDVRSYQAIIDELEELRDVHAGLEDVAAGRVVSHDEARARLLARYEDR